MSAAVGHALYCRDCSHWVEQHDIDDDNWRCAVEDCSCPTGFMDSQPDGVIFWRTRRGALILKVDHIDYRVGTVEEIDQNLATCVPQHRDRLLEARHVLYRQERVQ
jgi:hypothetical protein